MADEQIPGIQIPISADFSDLDAAFDAAVARALSDSQNLAGAIAAAMSTRPDISGLTGAADQIDAAWQKLGEDMAKALGITLPAPDVSAITDALGKVEQGFQEFSDAAQKIVSAQDRADSAWRQSVAVLQEINNAYESGTVSAETLARAQQAVADAFDKVNPSIKNTKEAVEGTSKAVDDAQQSMAAMNQVLGALGITLSIGAFVNFAESIGEAFDSLTKADIVLTRLTGDADQAAEMIGKLEQLGVQDGLSMPGLLQAAEKMERLVPAGTDIVGILSQLADASAVTGASIETLGTRFDSIVDSGKVADKTLKDFGLNLDLLKQAMADAGVNLDAFGGDVKKAFASLDQHDRIVVLQTALQDLKGVAEDVADNTFSGKWHQALAQWDADLGIIQRDMKPVADSFGSLKPVVNDLAAVLAGLATIVKAASDQVVGIAASTVTALTGIAGAAKDVITGNLKGAAQEIKDTWANLDAITKSTSESIKTDFAAGLKTVNDLMNQTTTAVKPVIDGLDGMGSHAKDAASKIADAAAAVKKFEDQLATGGSVSQLQKDFENASAAISKLATADLPAAIKAVDDYTQAQIRNGANASVMMEALTKYQGLLDKLAKEDLPAAVAGEQKLVDELAAAKEPLGLVTEAFEKEEAMIQKLAKEDYPAAIAAQEKLVTSLQGMPQYANLMNAAIDTLNKMLNDHEAAINKAVAAQQKFVDSIKNIALGIPGPQKAIDDMNRTLDLIGASAAAMPEKMTPLNEALINAGLGAQAAETNLKKIPAALDSIHTSITSVLGTFDALAKQAQDTGDWTNYEAALGKVDKRLQDMAKTDIPEAVTQWEALIQEMIKNGAPTDLVLGQLSKLEPLLKKMADEDLPGARAAWQGYLDILNKVPQAAKDIQQADEEQLQKAQQVLEAMQKRGDAYGYILDQQAKVLQGEIAYAEKTGEDSNNIVLALEKVRLQQEANRLSSHGYADEMVKGINDILKGFDQLGATMADAIVNGKNLGDALINEFKKIGQSILGDIINLALVPLKKDLVDLIGSFLPEYAAKTAAATAGTAALGAASTTTAGAQVVLSASALEAAGSLTALGIASSLAAIQTNTLIAAIAAVVGAIAGIVGDVYLAAIDTKLFTTNTTLAAIKNDLANLRADQWSQYNHMYDRLGECKNALDSINDNISALAGSSGTSSSSSGGPTVQSDLDLIVVSMQATEQHTQSTNFSVQALNQTTTPLLQAIISGLQDINNTLFKINTSILGGQSHGASNSQAIIDAIGQTAHGMTSNAIENANGIMGHLDTVTQTIDQQIQTQQAALAAAEQAAQAATDTPTKIQALQQALAADLALIDLEQKAGNGVMATIYQQGADSIRQELAALGVIATDTGNVATAVGSAANQTSAATVGVGNAVIQSGGAIVSAVNNSATVIANSVAAMAGAMALGGGINGPVSASKSGAGTGGSGPAPFAGPGEQSPVVQDVKLPGGGTGAYTTPLSGGGSTSTGSGGSGRSVGNPNPGDTTVKVVPQYQTGGMVSTDGLLAAEKGESVLTPDQTDALMSLGHRLASDPGTSGAGDSLISKAQGAHVVPQGGQPERVAYGTQGPDSAGIGPAVDAIAAADKAAKDAAKAMQDRLDLLNQQLASSIARTGPASIQTIELEMQIRDLMNQIAGSTGKTADNTGTMASNPPGAGPSTATSQNADTDQIAQLKAAVAMAFERLNAAQASGNADLIAVAKDNLQTLQEQLAQAQAAAAKAAQQSDAVTVALQAVKDAQEKLLLAQQSGNAAQITQAQMVLNMAQQNAAIIQAAAARPANSISPGAGPGEYYSGGGVGPGPGPSAGNPLSPGAGPGEYFGPGQQGILPFTPVHAQQIPPSPTPHPFFSGYNPYGASQPFLAGSFAEGGRVPETGPYLVHKDEEVIPSEISQALRRMLTVPMSPQLTYQAASGGGAHGPITVNANITITAGAQDGEQIARKLVAHLKRVIPQGGLTS